MHAALSSSGDGKGLPWVKFDYIPCPDSVNGTVKACDAFESCVATTTCFEGDCDATTQAKVAAFASCFEGFQGQKEGYCTEDNFSMANATRCSRDVAGLDYDAILSCFQNDTATTASMQRLDAVCQKTFPLWFPYVIINGNATGSDEKDMFPILPKLCAAYEEEGGATPKEC